MVFYESPHRIVKSLASLSLHVGNDRQIVLARELTKIYEQFLSGSALELEIYFTKNPDKVRGEFVVMVSGK